jgi:small subunit ribosomal protein S1
MAEKKTTKASPETSGETTETVEKAKTTKKAKTAKATEKEESVEPAKTAKTDKATESVETTETVEAVEETTKTVEETPETVEAVEAPVKTETSVNPEKFLKDFNWHNYEEGIDQVDDKQLKEFEKLVSENFVDTLNDEVVMGEVIHISDRDAIIDINAKSEGVISLNEFRYNPNLKVGDKVEVLIDVREDATGQLVLSHRKARVIKAWDRVNNAHDTGEIVNGFVKCRTKGGMIVDVFGIEAFLPGSQIDVKPIRDYDQYVNKTMEFKVVKINHEFKNIVVSHKALIEADIEEQKKEIIGQLEKGQVLEGIVKNITSYGVFIDLGGVDGLIHITDLSWSRINHPNEIVELDEKLNVVILDFDEDKSRIQLGLKQLSKHPWEALADGVKIGDKVKGKVVVIADYGAFVEVEEGVEGLVHVSEMSWSTHLRSAQDFVSVGDEIEAVILTLGCGRRRYLFKHSNQRI